MGGGAQCAEGPGAAEEGEEGLRSAARLEALRQVRLSASADPGMERFARLVADTLGVPVALASLVEADRQVFPGQAGLAEPWASGRQAPLARLLCQRVAATGSPLVLADARQDEQARGTAAISDPQVIAYAGMPLTDSEGHVLGSLRAIDTQPRAWSPRELARLADLAAACCAELRLRITSRRAAHALDAAARSQATAQEYAAQARLALDRSELMLRAAEDLAGTAGLADVRRRVRNLVTGNLKPSYVGLALLDGQQLRWVPDADLAHSVSLRSQAVALEDADPGARAARQGRMVIVTGRAARRAATIMGQIRSMLRQADLDHLDRGPAAAVTAVENACTALGLDATGTLVHAHLSPAGGGAWHLSWTNAGHPPPLLLDRPGGQPERLAVHDRLLWPGMTGSPRTSQQRLLPPGATLLLYTDGLVERRGDDIDAAIDRTAAALAAAPASQPLPALLEQLAAEIADPSAADDMVLLAARIPAGRA